MSGLLRSLIVRVGADTTKAQSEFKKLAKELKTSGKNLANTGASLTKGLTVPLIGVAAGLGAIVGKSLESADALQKMSDVTGLTTERLQELKYIGTKVDVELETMTGAQSKLIKAMSAARDGTKAQSDAFKKLGISVVDNNGNLRDSNTVFTEAIAALGKMENPTERDAIALKLFGKSAMELNPLIKAGADEIANLTKEAHDNGAVMSGESVKALDNFGDEIAALKISLQTAASEIAVALLPTLQRLLPYVKEKIIPAIKDFAKFVGNLVRGFLNLSPFMQKVVGGFVLLAAAIGPALTLIGKFKIGISTMLTVVNNAAKAIKGGAGLTGALSALLGPAGIIMLVVAAVAVLVGAFLAINQSAFDATNRVKGLVKEFDETTTSYENNSKEIQHNADLTTDLTNQLYDLANKENKTNEEKAKMKELVSQINTLMPELNLTLDEQTGLLNKNKEAVTDYITEKTKELELRANEEYLLKLYQDRLKLQDEITAAQERHTAAVKKFGQGKSVGMELKKSKEALDLLNGAWTRNEQNIQKADGAYKDLYGTATTVTDAIQTETEELAATTQASTAGMEEYWAQFKDAIVATTETFRDQMGSLEDDGIKKTELTAKQIKHNLEQQIEDFKNWRKSIAELASKVPSDVLEELKALGPGFAPVIDDLNKMSKTKLDAWVGTWREAAGTAGDAALEEMNNKREQFIAAGTVVGEYYGRGLTDSVTAAMAAYKVPTPVMLNPFSKPTVKAPYAKVTNPFAPPSYDVGTNYVPNDTLAQIHKGEAIIPAEYNKPQMFGQKSITVNVNGSTDPNMVAGIVVQKLRMAGAV